MGGGEAGIAQTHQQGQEGCSDQAAGEILHSHRGDQAGESTPELRKGPVGEVGEAADDPEHPEGAVEAQGLEQHAPESRSGHGGGDPPAPVHRADLGRTEAGLEHEGHRHPIEQSIGPAIEHHQNQDQQSPAATGAAQEFLRRAHDRLPQTAGWMGQGLQGRGREGERHDGG